MAILGAKMHMVHCTSCSVQGTMCSEGCRIKDAGVKVYDGCSKQAARYRLQGAGYNVGTDREVVLETGIFPVSQILPDLKRRDFKAILFHAGICRN